ncbi:zinc finger domain-containing protein [Trichoderma cornu-damae]|uniref:Zinc finger domain-containing protein n=1 Tax=Trichoderma cornu-damae TaxID=654480 RepID=A0A9P8QI70_9HYPO|nr:zinc finger domain-containing protein [Trichoderma cornu-damae]
MPLVHHADVDKLDGLAARACDLCHKKDGLLRCSACQAVYYCGRECQARDRADHKMSCKVIKKARLRYELEEKLLRDKPSYMFPGKMFEDYVGRFWGIVETRPYMRARYGLVDSMLVMYGSAGGPVDVVQTALDHLSDMMRLCRGDNMGLRDMIPALYIRLGRDQHAYDFMKWYATTGMDRHYDWGDMKQPFLDVKDADVLEAPAESWTDNRFPDLSHAVAAVLIKVRVLLDLQAVQNARMALRGVALPEIIEAICGQLVGPILRTRPEILLAKPQETAQLAEKIKSQVREVYRAVEKYNPYFWDLLVNDPDAGVLQRPTESYSHRTRDEALLVLGFSYAAWYETPRAVNVLRTLSKAFRGP